MVRFCALFPGSREPIGKTSNADPPAASITNTPVWLELWFRCLLPQANNIRTCKFIQLTPALFSLPSPSCALHQRALKGQFRYSEDDECQKEGWWLRWILVTNQMETHVHNRTSNSLPWAWLCPWRGLLIIRRSWHKDLRAGWATEERYLERDC